MRVEIWSDVVCPWCYIGKRKFETALAEFRATDGANVVVDVSWRPYQLDPTAPAGGAQPVMEAYAKKFGGPERAAQIITNVTGVAAEVGLPFRMDIALRANTREAHRLLGYALTHHGATTQDALKERLLAAYFIEGRNVGDHDTLTELATDVGLPADKVAAFLDSDSGIAELNEELAETAAHGITAVPTFVFDGKWAVPGAQDPDMFLRALRRMHELEVEQAAAAANACEDDVCEI
jgi:predicted DsbA family dithiol-disulfide isomerase